MSNYLIELAIIHIALALGYWCFLRKEQQYGKLRFYLIASTLLAIIIPMLKLPKLLFNGREPIELPLEVITLNAAPATPVEVSILDHQLVIWVYLLVSLFFLFKFISSLRYLLHLKNSSNSLKFQDSYIRRTPGIKGSFTFFNWIFLGDEYNDDSQDCHIILRHEKAHASLGHSYDVIFFELFRICFWWLPTIWYIRREIKKIHEYQADAYALRSYDVDRYSSLLISATLQTNGLSLASSFHDGFILKRLNAMKQKTKNVSPWKIGMLAALGTFLFLVFACSEDLDPKAVETDGQDDKLEEVFSKVEDLPEFNGGMEGLYKYIASEIKYPAQARRMGIEGRVHVQFVVEKDGSLSNIKALKGIGAGCDEEAIRVVQNAPAFKPGSQGGRPVRVRMELPIIFKLDHEKTNDDNSTQGMVIIDKVVTQLNQFTVNADYAHGEWSGTVYDEQGNGLPGANVVVAGTSVGTATALDGSFRLKAGESNDLLISFVGYESVKLPAK